MYYKSNCMECDRNYPIVSFYYKIQCWLVLIRNSISRLLKKYDFLEKYIIVLQSLTKLSRPTKKNLSPASLLSLGHI